MYSQEYLILHFDPIQSMIYNIFLKLSVNNYNLTKFNKWFLIDVLLMLNNLLSYNRKLYLIL